MTTWPDRKLLNAEAPLGELVPSGSLSGLLPDRQRRPYPPRRRVDRGSTVAAAAAVYSDPGHVLTSIVGKNLRIVHHLRATTSEAAAVMAFSSPLPHSSFRAC